MKSTHVSQVIAARPSAVYDFAANPDNLPRWAAGLISEMYTGIAQLMNPTPKPLRPRPTRNMAMSTDPAWIAAEMIHRIAIN